VEDLLRWLIQTPGSALGSEDGLPQVHEITSLTKATFHVKGYRNRIRSWFMPLYLFNLFNLGLFVCQFKNLTGQGFCESTF
jgi:hypothetical protein